MDNFMDKLAEKYNAQDMIRANSQAETAQMQSLQDQVEAYEAVLQEMRKLNYRNTELTEKMYALVDASIEKVRTLQIEAKESGADTAEVSREMHDAVNQAVSEAISNMDETMARTLAESLQQPTDEMRQSHEQISAVKEEMGSVKEEVLGARNDIREISAATDLLIESLSKQEEAKAPQEILDKLQELSVQVEELKNASLHTEAPQEVMSGLSDLSAQIAGLKTEEKPAEAPQEIMDKLEELSMQIEDLKAKEEETIRFNADAMKAPEVSNQEILDALRSAENANKENKADLLEELRTSDNAIQDRLFAIQQSNTTTEETLASVASAVAALRDNNGPVELPQEVMDKLEELSMQIEDLKAKEEETVRFNADAMKVPEVSNQEILDALRSAENANKDNKADLLEELRASDNAIQDRLFAIQQSNTTTEDSLSSIAAAMAALRDNNGPVELPQEVLDKLEELSMQIEDVRTAEKPAEAPQEVIDKLDAVSAELEALKSADNNAEVLEKIEKVSAEISGLKEADNNAEVLAKIEEVSAEIAGLKETDNNAEVLEKLQALSEKTAQIYEKQQQPDADAQTKELLETLQKQVKVSELTQETLSALTQSNVQTQDSLTEMRSVVDGLSDRSAQEENNKALTEKLEAVQQDAKSAKEALFYLRTSSDESKGSLEELKGIGNDTKAGLQDIYDSIEKAKKGIADIKAQQMQPQMREGDEEIRQALTELLSGQSDLTTSLRNVKSASDDTKNTLRSSLDTAIYGIKQDNKELIGILQRMNSTLTSRDDAEEKAQKEEEERARIEEDRRLLEERFKLTEDFMHKESVKVYRNVQAVINEKNDKQRENLDSNSQNVASSIAKVKIWAIIATILAGADLIVTILDAFGILDNLVQ